MSDDLISREDLKNTLNEIFDTVEVMLFDDIIAIIDNAPTDESVKELYEKIETFKNSYRIMSDAFENEVRKTDQEASG